MDSDAARGASRSPVAPDPEELRLLADQLARMRGMLFGYSERFFERIRTWTLLALALLVISGSGIFAGAIVAVPFLVPFAFLETGYLFYYTVFARRHAEFLERAINSRLGRDVLVAHRLEAAYFYPPDSPKVAALSFGRPLGMMSIMTISYTGAAALLWLVGITGLATWVDVARAHAADSPGPRLLLDLAIPGAIAWTLLISAYLAWTFLTRHDEQRLITELDAAYRASPGPALD
jgi:hypothetical protein